jgi:hypothetical protein
MYIYIILAGFAGGVLRGLVGFVKYQMTYKDVKFRLYYFLGMIAISGVIGFITAITVKELGLNFLGIEFVSPALAIVIGYAGGDFLENLYKIILKKPSIYSLPEDLIIK